MSEENSLEVVIQSKEPNYYSSILMGEHTIIADEPVSLGGGDAGAMPTQLLLASLGSCTSITIRMYAQRKQMKLDSVTVTVTMEKLSPESHRIHRRLELRGDLSTEQRERLLQVANACPVHKLLVGQIQIETGLA